MRKKITKVVAMPVLTIARRSLVGCIAVLMCAAAQPAFSEMTQQSVVDKALRTLEVFTTDPALAVVPSLIERAKGIVLVPAIFNVGLIVGGGSGPAVLLVRDSTKGWSDPAFYSFRIRTVGLQMGAQLSRFVLVVATERGIEALLNGQLLLDGDWSVEYIGAFSEDEAAASCITSDVCLITRSRALFGGIDVAGGALHVDSERNSAYYGKPVTPKEIVIDHSVNNSGSLALKKALDAF